MTTFFNKVCENVNNFNNNVNGFLDDKFKKIDNCIGSSLCKFDAQHGGCLKTTVKVTAVALLLLAVVGVVLALVHGGAAVAAGGGVVVVAKHAAAPLGAVVAKHAAAVGGKVASLVAKHPAHGLLPPVPHSHSGSGGPGSLGDGLGAIGIFLGILGAGIGVKYLFGNRTEPKKYALGQG